MKSRLLLTIVGLAMVTGSAFAGVTLDIRYVFEQGAGVQSHVSATIDGVEMGANVPLAVTGGAKVDLTLDVLGVADDGVATLRASFGKVEATLLDEPQNAGTPSPIEMRVDRRGALVGLRSDDASGIDIFASGGVPLQFVVLLAGIAEMPVEPVDLGGEWVSESRQQIPQVGEVTMNVRSRIVEISGDEMVLLTDMEASLPDFSSPNPMQAGEITVQNGVLTIEGLRRTVDMRTGLIKSADARMHFNGFAAIGPFPPLPLSVTSSFTIVPAPRPEQAAHPAGVQGDG
ncbi:MAG: hypothetical protein ACOX9R_15100 [Armatimonadota bacterium]|jgi:hypothetical protein